MTKNHLNNMVRISIVAALYIVLTFVTPFGFGAIQIRLSEALNHLAIFNKRYIVALTIGCAIANLFSPMGIIDVIFGTLGTLMMTSVSYYGSRHLKKRQHQLLFSTLVCTVSTWTVALELHLVSELPFWVTYGSVAVGELFSLLVGFLVMIELSRRIDLSK